MLGHRVEVEYTKKVKGSVLTFDEVFGAYDIVLHNYGPDRYLGSVHIEIDDRMTADKIDSLTRNITQKVYEDTGIILTAVGIYSNNSSNEHLMKMRKDITELVVGHKHILFTKLAMLVKAVAEKKQEEGGEAPVAAPAAEEVKAEAEAPAAEAEAPAAEAAPAETPAE